MSQAEALSEEKRARIMAGAGAVFAADGYEGASMAGIAARAGVSKGTLYNYFPSKAALFAAYVRRCSRPMWARSAVANWSTSSTWPTRTRRRRRWCSTASDSGCWRS